MHVTLVHVHVKPEHVDAFRHASIEDAQNSIQEPGIARFDVVQQLDDPAQFVLVEVYRTPDDPARHKETAHYKTWRATVADMMAEPRFSVIVCTRDGHRRILDCLAAVSRLGHDSYEVVVVDDGSRDGTARRVVRRFPGVRVLRLAACGLSAARNAGAAAARGPHRPPVSP